MNISISDVGGLLQENEHRKNGKSDVVASKTPNYF